ncbi:MAG: sensor histidine kinase [Tractidigestivibacter sp.]|jgi:signal transduction histidine kinase|uniref:sensor histidine kinase n=1 Tax=Tractidigestivibacter sp. TaxID=2847320 RepID=UPI003D8D3A77
MKLSAFLLDRAGSLAIRICGLGIAALVMVGVGVEPNVAMLILGTLLACGAISLLIEWLPRRSFWRQVRDVCDDESLALDVTSVVDEPGYREGLLAWETLDDVSQAGRAGIARASQDSNEYHEFIDAWVHEVKTPIAAARLACDNNPGELATRVSRELDRMDGYVEQALYYARSGTLERDYVIAEVRVGDVVGDALKAHKRTLIDQRIAPKLEDGMDLTVFADAKWIRFVLGQILENAAKYRAPESAGRQAQVAISARRLDKGRANDRVELEVRDNGIGIPAADLPRIFEKGFVGSNGRLPGQSRSTGLGLYLVRRLCQKMGLSVRADSREGEWTAITISFPNDSARMLDE